MIEQAAASASRGNRVTSSSVAAADASSASAAATLVASSPYRRIVCGSVLALSAQPARTASKNGRALSRTNAPASRSAPPAMPTPIEACHSCARAPSCCGTVNALS
jgi:hypothetical protein